MKNITKTLLSLLLFVVANESFARPEYAIQHTYVSCTMCHVSPFGGGIKTTNGKQYAAHGFNPGVQSKQEWFQLDFRMEALTAEAGTGSGRRGMAVMTTTPAVHIPVIKNEISGQEELGFVTSYGLGSLSTGLLDGYALYQIGDSTEFKRPMTQMVMGRFQVPFGLATDEHRTYTKIQTMTTSKDYSTGFGLSGDPSAKFHYDVVSTTGTQTGSAVKDDAPWAIIGNMRLNPTGGPMMLGMSYSRTGTQKVEYPLEAFALYGGWGFGEIFKGKAKGTILGEVVWAHGWNNSNINSGMTYFIPSAETAWQTALNDSHSLGMNLQINYEINNRWTLVTKGEQFIPDTNFKGDAFNRGALGFRYFMNSNMYLYTRYENSYCLREGITETSGAASTEKTIFAMLQLSI